MLVHIHLPNTIYEFSSALQLHRKPIDLPQLVNLIPRSAGCFYDSFLDTQGQPTPWSRLHKKVRGHVRTPGRGQRNPCCPLALL